MKKQSLKSFKVCTRCGYCWPTRSSFLDDSELRMIGYQADFENLRAGLFLFNHVCGTTLSIRAEDFRDLYSGPIFLERLYGTGKCEGFCLHKDDLRRCRAKCECAYVREIVQVILKWPKNDSSGVGHGIRR